MREDAEADSPFETSVANALRARGHDVALQVGVAGCPPSEPMRQTGLVEEWRISGSS